MPIHEWEKLTAELKETQTSSGKKSAVLKSIEKGLREMEAIKKGKLKSISIKQLLDDL